MTDTNGILSLAREEYTDKLCNTLTPLLYEGLKGIWNNVKANNKEKCLLKFQQQLSLIPKWNREIIDNECERISEKVSISTLEKIVEAVFIFNIKILSSIGNDKNINLTIPEIKHFIHKCYINCAREFYTNPYIIDDRTRVGLLSENIKLQKNYKECINLINLSINRTIKECIPIEQILEQYLNSELNDNDIHNDRDNLGDSSSHDSNSESDSDGEEDNNLSNGDTSGIPYQENVRMDDSEDTGNISNLLTTEGDDITNVPIPESEQNPDKEKLQEYKEYDNGVFQTINTDDSQNTDHSSSIDTNNHLENKEDEEDDEPFFS